VFPLIEIIVLSQNHFPCGNDTRIWQRLNTKDSMDNQIKGTWY